MTAQMNINTFPMTVEAIHSTGLNIVRCPALGTRDFYLTDDMGDFVRPSHMGNVFASLHEASGSH